MASWIKEIIDLRKQLHDIPELSGLEKKTSVMLQNTLASLKMGSLIPELGGGNGFVYLLDSGNPGPTAMIRGDMDAISKDGKAAHLCGHDGHSAILTGLAFQLASDSTWNGKTGLLFQAEEETGKGAEKVIGDPRFQDLKADWIFGIHNIPGYEHSSVLFTDGCMAWGSEGLLTRFFGPFSHAAYPEKAIQTALAMNEFCEYILKDPGLVYKDTGRVTLAHCRLGDKTFGVTPGVAAINTTLRSESFEGLNQMRQKLKDKCREIALKYSIDYTNERFEPFPPTINHAEAVELLHDLCHEGNWTHQSGIESFRWSEDFGHYLKDYRGALIGLGSGINNPGLHHHQYAFPDEIILPAVKFLEQLIHKIAG